MFRLEGEGDLGCVFSHFIKDSLDGVLGCIGKDENVINIAVPMQGKKFKEMGENSNF